MSHCDDLCAGKARDGGPCTFTRQGHHDGLPHAFVEPVPAPQPPADATPSEQCAHIFANGKTCGRSRFDWGVHPGSGAKGSETHSFIPPAPPADAAPLSVVEELARRHAVEDYDTFGPYDDVDAAAGVIEAAVREALLMAAELCEADGLNGIRLGQAIRTMGGIK